MMKFDETFERAKGQPVFDRLEPDEQRVLIKTVLFLEVAASEGRQQAEDYITNMLPKQRTVLQKVVTLAKELDLTTPRELQAFRVYGFDC